MNLMIDFMKKRGATMVLPLLLLTTACGEEAPSTSQDSALPDLANLSLDGTEADEGITLPDEVAVVASADGMTAVNGESDEESLSNVLTLESDETLTDVAAQSEANLAVDVPEPVTFAGLAVAALGLSIIKRR